MQPILRPLLPPGAGGKDSAQNLGAARHGKDKPCDALGSLARAAGRFVNAPAAVALISAGVGGGSLYLAAKTAGHTHGGYVERGLNGGGTRFGVGAAAAGSLVALALVVSGVRGMK